MRKLLRTHLTTVIVAMVTAAVTAGGPAIAATIADYAKNSDKVDGKHAVGAGAKVAARAGKLVATNSAGRLPNNIIAKAPDANRLDGLNSTAFLRSNGKAADAENLDGLDSTAFLRSNGKAADAENLDGLDSTAFLRSDGKAADADLLDGIDAAAFARQSQSPTFDTTLLNATISLATATQDLASVTVTAPSDGYALVTASGTVGPRYPSHSNGTPDFARLFLSPTSLGAPWETLVFFELPGSAPTGSYAVPFSATKTFPVSAGENTFYLTGNMASGVGQVTRANMTALFISQKS